MKRTAEKVMSIIGIVINLFMIGMAVLVNVGLSDATVRNSIEQELNNDPAMANSGVDINMVMDLLGGIGWGFVIVVLISTVLSIIALAVMKRKSKMAGILLIVSALIVGIGTVLLGWLPAILFLIAGIMCLVRKPKEEIVY
ncbi:DUF4064 domain-containing protein [Peribacillus alkalitolerans]|uniref:DUF4064 domain-containing protein n=1 Tax=Peribacillus alkalitolerans TaxID=1550385 RepID=UPI0013D1B53C|nr:DUF4064 domain-containing protein [Peribacillus alkalitolerans]